MFTCRELFFSAKYFSTSSAILLQNCTTVAASVPYFCRFSLQAAQSHHVRLSSCVMVMFCLSGYSSRQDISFASSV